ncbi:MAG: LacI family DNA-binding transcriptional regulator [Firmicutes bacterium]|nr:LacI family DNA-binding transcriptional regulator [Bacillota bacterium]
MVETRAHRVQLKEIAEALNISPATVSLVLHNKPGVSEETRAMVREALIDSGYGEAALAAATNSIHLLKYNVFGYDTGYSVMMINDIYDAIVMEGRKMGWSISATTCHEGEFKKFLELTKANPMDGMIIMGTALPMGYEEYLDLYKKPLVLVDTYAPSINDTCVVVNNRQCLYLAIEALYKQGHRSIGLIYNCFQTYNYLDRYEGFMRGMRDFGLKAEERFMFPVNPMMDDAYDNIVAIMEMKGDIPTAMIADNTTIAVGMLGALRNRGYDIPKDVSLIAIGDTRFCRMTTPKLSVINVSAEEMGKAAIRKLNSIINQRDEAGGLICINGKYVQRESVASPK